MGLKKTEKYRAECEAIVERLRTILELDADNSFYLCELDGNEEKQRRILELVQEIKVCFYTSSWTGVKAKNTVRPYLTIVKNVFKNMGYLVLNKRVNISNNTNKNGEIIKTTRYYIVEKTQTH